MLMGPFSVGGRGVREAQLKGMAGEFPGGRGPRLGPEDGEGWEEAEGTLEGGGLGKVLQAERHGLSRPLRSG